MEKSVWIAAALVSLAICAVIYFFITSPIKGELFIPIEKRDFLILCAQWNNLNCTNSALDSLDQTQRVWSGPTLTDLCLKNYPDDASELSITKCKDICKNNCYEKLYFDVAVYADNIIKQGNTIKIVIFNKGTASVYNVDIAIYNLSTSRETPQYETSKNITSKESIEITCYIDIVPRSGSCNGVGKYVGVRIDRFDYLKETEEENNYAEQNWLISG